MSDLKIQDNIAYRQERIEMDRQFYVRDGRGWRTRCSQRNEDGEMIDVKWTDTMEKCLEAVSFYHDMEYPYCETCTIHDANTGELECSVTFDEELDCSVVSPHL
jgi:hypothetical protein